MAQDGVAAKKKVRVLIADDAQETRRSVRLMLSMNPDALVVAIAMNGHQAIELAKDHHPDIVIMDILMPDLDGLTAFKEIHQIYPDIGCIIITAQKDLDALNRALALGAQEYLVKPFSIEEMNAAVNRVAATVLENRRKQAEAEELRQKRAANLDKLADEYARSKRTDAEALGVFEQLAENPACDLRWLRTLAMIYILRREWSKLKHLAERLEQQDSQ
jgi:YesN/AraC family two-component response regulator